MSEGRQTAPALDRLRTWLFAPQPVAGLAFCRLAFGLVLAYEIVAFFAAGWIEEYFSGSGFHFTYLGFGWVKPLPEPWLSVHFVVTGVAALGVAFGCFQRLSALLFFLGFSAIFLVEKARYLNHFYLVVVLAFLWIFLPAHHDLSVDARRRGERRAVPRLAYLVLQFQIGLVYCYAGVAKFNEDWLRAQPLLEWLPRRADRPLVGPIVGNEAAAWVLSYGGLTFDLLVWPALVWKRTRPYAFAVCLTFHLLNAMVFGIGIFPWLMIAVTTIFFAPDWPRAALRRIAPGSRLLRRLETAPPSPESAVPAECRSHCGILAAVLLFALVQIFVPLRHFLYPGVVHWTEEGHLFSWHMKLRSKDSDARFLVKDKVTGAEVLVDPRVDLSARQYDKMKDRPDMILQYAHHLGARQSRERGHPVEVYAKVIGALNDRHAQWLIDPDVDLMEVERDLTVADWIVPLEPRVP